MDTSNHMCLICNKAIIGLVNYVEHFKSHATPQDGHIVEEKLNTWELKSINSSASLNGEKSNFSKNEQPNQRQSNHSAQESGTYSGDTSPLSEFIDNQNDYADPDLEGGDLLSSKRCPDFFQSLELKSATEDPAPKPKIKAVQRLSILEDDLHAESLLPITSILSNLEFSSDEEFLHISDSEEENAHVNEENFWLSEEAEDRSSSHPPHGHTGGKWRPGEMPKPRRPISGKWKPGHGPGPACRKNILRKQFRTRGSKGDLGKIFYCNVCNSHYSDRNSYSLHFSQPQHKEFAEAKKQEKSGQDYLEENERQGEESTEQAANNETQMNKSSAKPRNKNDSCHCPVCDLYFDNANVFSIHCETKLHKDGMLKRGYREFKACDGNVIRIDVQQQTISTEKADALWTALDQRRQLSPQKTSESKEQETHNCHICQKHFTRKYEMARHLLTRMHRARAQKHPEADSVEMLNKYNKYMIRLSPFQCGVCQFYFNRQRDFLDHMGSSKHVLTCQDMLGPIMCVPCKYKTHKHNEMMEHVQYPEHLVAVEKKHGTCIVRESHTRITCKFCGVKMYSAVRMRRHCQRRHNDRLTEVQVTMFVKPVEYNKYDCPMCKKSFRAKSLLQLHFLKIHKNTSLFNCNVCNRGYLDQRRLDNHLRTRFHAKRVIAQKLTGAQKQKSAGLRTTTIGQKLNRRRGRAKRTVGRPLDVNQGAMATDHKKEDPKEEYSQRLRRSTRKRKKMEFFDDDPEEEKEPEPVKITEPDHEIQINRKSRKKWTRLKNAKDGPGEKKNIKLSLKNYGSDKSETSDAKAGQRSGKNEREISETTNSQDKNSSPRNKSSLKTVKKTEKNSLTGENANENTDCLKEDSEENFTEKEDDDDDFSLGEGQTDAQDSVDEEKLNEASKHIFSCTYCDFAATDLTGLRGHYNENHPNDILTCQPCNQYFLSLKAYKIHCSGRGHQLKLREQSGETKMHKCPMCDKRFLQESCSLLHLETVHRHPSCETDIQRINKGQDLVTQLYGDHVKQVESLSNETSVSCPECGKFVRKDTLVEHLRLHTGERPYACRFCSKGFAGRLTLRRHISSHLNMPMFMCDTCGREFKRNSHLIKHIRQHDFEKKGEKHTCQICKASFFTPEELSRHMRRHGDRNYKCAWPGCHWTFVLSGELKSHMFTHTGEKKYLCDICGFGAPTKTRLRRHEKTHDKSRNFNCDYCPYKASCKTHLKRHMRIHINSRPFACPYCNYTCNTHENIRKHILKTQKHKGMKLYPCKLCCNFGCDSSKEFRAHLMTVHANYLRENSIDSLAVFSGLYKREEDFQQPKEGSEIIQVTKGRFFRSYQNPDAPIEPPKPKKTKKSSLKSKMEEVKVIIVHPSELEEDGDKLQHKEEPEQFLQQLQHEKKGQVQQQQHHLSQAHQQQQGQLRQLLQDQSQQQHQNHQQQMMMEQQEDESQEEEEEEEVEQDDEEAEEESSQETEAQQYIEVPNMVIHSFNPQQSQQLSGTTVSFTSSVLPHTQPQQLPVTVSMTDDKLYWTVLPEHKVVLPAAPTPEPWYSGMPQVHAPTSQELQQYRPIEVTTSHPGSFLANSYFCNIPVGDIQTIQSTVGGPIYTSLVENVVVLSDPTRPETAGL